MMLGRTQAQVAAGVTKEENMEAQRRRVILQSGLVDGFLRVTLCKYGFQFVTWIYNEQTDSFHHGNYFDSFDDALEDYIGRRVGYRVATESINSHGGIIL